MENSFVSREDADKKYLWKTEDLYESDEKWQTDYDGIKDKLKEFDKYKGKLNADNFTDCLDFSDKINLAVERLYVYANLKANEDSTNTFYQSMSDKANMLVSIHSQSCSFIASEILDLDEAQVVRKAKDTVYAHYIEDLFRSRKHILSADKEELLAAVYEISQAPDNIFGMLNNADMMFEDAQNSKSERLPLSHGKYSSYLESSDRVLRKSAFENYYKAYENLKNTISVIYSSSLKKDVFYARARNYKTSLESMLEPNNIPIDVYKNLIKAAHNNIGLLHRYVRLRKKRLKLDELHFYDIYTPIVENINIKMTYEDAKREVKKALEPLGDEYINTLSKGLEEGWVDVYENKGKRSGAYAWGAYGTHPYVSLNYDNNINSMFTLAHEMGHAMHSHYTWTNQPHIYGDYTIFVAEVASTVNEALLTEYLLKNTDDKQQKMYLINYYMEQFKGTFFRQTMFAEFELIVHEKCEQGEPLTFDALCEIYAQLNKQYYGEDIVIDEQIKYEWARIPHFYTPFYVYQYATGYSAAIALSRNILDGKAEDYISFLKSGSSDYSINLLKSAGVDMGTTEPIEKALKVFDELITLMEKETE